MARERQQTVIDGHKYDMGMLSATTGIKLSHRLFTIFGPSFGAFMDAIMSGTAIQDVDLAGPAVISGIQSLTMSCKESDLLYVTDLLKGQCHVGADGNENTIPLKGVFELHFQGDIGGYYKWLWWGLQVQYQTFIDALQAGMQRGESEQTPDESSPTP